MVAIPSIGSEPLNKGIRLFSNYLNALIYDLSDNPLHHKIDIFQVLLRVINAPVFSCRPTPRTAQRADVHKPSLPFAKVLDNHHLTIHSFDLGSA